MKSDCVSHFNIGAPNITHRGNKSHLLEIFMSKKKKKHPMQCNHLKPWLFYQQRFDDPCIPPLLYVDPPLSSVRCVYMVAFP